MSPDRDGATKERAIELALARLRLRLKLWLTLDRASLLIGSALLICMAAGVVDYLVRMPRPMRLGLWIVGLGLLIGAVRKLLLPAVRFRPSLADLALRVEQTEAGREAGLRDVLAAGLEFSEKKRDEAPASLDQQVSLMASGLLGQFSLSRAVRPAGGARRGILTLLAAVVPLAVLASTAPMLTLLGTRRLLLPWENTQWPSRTAVLDATVARAHPLGTALPLRALLTRTNKAPGETRIWVRYRLLSDGKPGEIESSLLTSQGQRHDSEVSGEIYERLIDARALTERAGTASPETRRSLQYWFETADARTDAGEIDLVEPPVITDASMTITPPVYARLRGADGPEFVSGTRDLGAGRPDMPTVAPILAGSQVQLQLSLNKPVPLPALESESAKFAESLLQGASTPAGLKVSAGEKTLTLSWKAEDSMRFAVVLEDERGIRSPDPAGISLVVVPDRSPSVSVIEPTQDETILASAVIDATGEARDDLALALLTLEARVLAAKADSPGAPPEPRGQPLEIAKWEPTPDSAEKLARAKAVLEVSTLSVKPGDEIHLIAIAQDTYALDGKTHAPVLSAPRKLRVIGEGQFVEQIVAELGALRAAAVRLDRDQQQLQRTAQELDKAGGSDRAARLKKEQDSLTQRLRPPAALAKRLKERVERNALPDRAVRQMLDDAGSLLDQAAESSKAATDWLQRASKDNPDSPADAEASRAAKQSQSEVRDAISKLASILDQGKDGWATRREIEKLLEDQRRTTEQTREFAKVTGGKRVADLSLEQKRTLDRIAQAQQDLAKRARAATDALQDRAGKVKPQDPAQAEAMENAAGQSSRDQLSDTMQQASKSAGENQTSTANDLQTKAEETLKRMMEELDKGSQRKDESLRRMLADLVQRLEDLMSRQSEEIARLADASKVPAGETLDGLQIRLNQDTIVVSESTKKAGAELAPVGSLVDAGAGEQEQAVKSLRLSPIDSPGADRRERLALEHLTQARDMAKKLRDESQKREEDRQREELRKAYQDALNTQLAIRGDTSGFVGKELSRRDRAAVRSLGDKQDELRGSLAELQKKTKDLSEEGVFRFTHLRMDTLMQRAAVAMKEGAATSAVDSDQGSAATLLRSLVEALGKDKGEDDFRNAEGGSGGGGGQQGGDRPVIPPIAELKLLRSLQQEAAAGTRALHESEKPDPALVADVGNMQREIARQGQELVKKLAKKKKEQDGQAPKPEKEDDPAKPNGEKPGGPEDKDAGKEQRP